MTLRTIEYQDDKGRRWLRQLPDGVPDTQASRGIPLGPPPLSALGLPEDVEIRLHNQLYSRGILTATDARRRLPDIQAAIQAAFRVDVNAILVVFEGAPDGS